MLRYSVGGRTITFDADLPGHDRPFVFRPEDILPNGIPPLAGKIVIFDGEGLHTSVGIADFLGGKGTQIDYVTPGFSPVSRASVRQFAARFILQRLKPGRRAFRADDLGEQHRRPQCDTL